MNKSVRGWRGIAVTTPFVLMGLAVAPTSASAVTGDAAATAASFVARVLVGDGAKGEDFAGCSGSQIERDWVLTSATCLRATGAAPATTGAAPLRLTSFGGSKVLNVTLHPTRDVALLHIDNGDLGLTSGVTPVALAAAPAVAGETLRVIGAGRTGTEWVPNKSHAGLFTVQSAADAVSLAATGDASVCQGDAGGPVVRDVAGVPSLVAIISTSSQAGCLESTAPQGHTATAIPVNDLGAWIKTQTGNTGFETTDLPVVPNTAGRAGVFNVGGVIASVTGPELVARTERAHSGTRSLLYSGKDNSTTRSWAYMKVADVPNLPVDSRTLLQYWIYPAAGTGSMATGSNSSCVAVDLDFTDNTYLHSLKAIASNDVDIHPAKQCGHLTLNAWNNVQVSLGRYAAGKRIRQIMVGYEQPANTGGYRGFVDDITLYHGCVAVDGLRCALNSTGVLARQGVTAPSSASDVTFDEPAPVAEESAIDNYAYPGAARILAEQKVKLISGDGNLILADCSVPTTGLFGYIRLRTSDTTVGAKGQICLHMGNESARGMLKLELPGAISIRSDGYEDGIGHDINAVWRIGTDPAQMAPVPQNSYLSVGIADPDVNKPATLMEIMVL